MTAHVAFKVILLLVELAASAFFSAAETALFSLTPHELHRFRNDRRASHRLVAALMQRPRKLLLTLMVCNVTVNMVIFATSLTLIESLLAPGSNLGPVVGLIAPIAVTLFGEILPKGTSIVMRKTFALQAAPLARACQVILAPVTWILHSLLVEPLTRLLVGGRRPRNEVTIEELAELVEMSQHQRIIDADENTMLDGVIHLNELRVRDIMVPRVDIIAFDLRNDPQGLYRLMRECHLPKIPVYDGDIDRFKGLIYAKDLFLHHDCPPRLLVRRARFVPDVISLTQLLEHFRRTRSQLAMAVDEFGGITGLVTIQDVAAQIVGELAPAEQGENEPTWERLDDRHYRISGRVSVRDWAEQFDIRRFDDRVSTLGGLILAKLGRLPAVGDQLRLGNVLMTVELLRGRRVEWIRLELAADAAATVGDLPGKGA
ncbi:MAG TPA: hemolysin family protein [Phycisphaerae bacterium]|nr:hemolysin family protein [Phycisphaerae bacterium]